MKHGKNFILGEYVIIKKPELVEVGDNVRIADFCRISSGPRLFLSNAFYSAFMMSSAICSGVR